MNELEVKRVPFMGTDLMAAKDESGTIWAGVRWMCDGMGLSKGQRDRQITNINADSVISKGAANLRLPTAGGKQSVLCLKLDFVPLWLAKINITPAMQAETPELAERLEAYQLKAKDVLAAAFLPKKVQGGKPKPMTDYQQMMAEKWDRDHALQEARIYIGMAKRYRGTTYEQVLNAHATKSLSGQFYIRKSGIAALKCGFVAFGLLAIWLLGGIAEALGPWWLYLLASAGSFAVGVVLLGEALIAEDKLIRDMARAKQVPVRKIDRRHSA